ncbi:MAG: hypothetical protein NTV06_02080 [candidate division Zixibacteria bacterium]|nr:hypothetical protein [candidate division Zixibacteria bacterium]
MSDKERDQFSLPLESTARSKPESKDVVSESDNAVLEWICHPAKKNMKVTAAVSVFVVLLVVIVYYISYSVWLTVLGFMILYGSLSAFYFPTRYKLTGNEVIIKTAFQTLHKQWAQYRSFYPDKNGVLLSPFLRPSRLENFRGVYIRFGNNKDEVMAFVRNKLVKEEG